MSSSGRMSRTTDMSFTGQKRSGVGDPRANKGCEGVSVPKHYLPVFSLTSEEVGYAIEQRHEVWLTSQSGVVALESDGARKVGPTPATDVLVGALAAAACIAGCRPFESSGDWLPAHNVASVCSKECQVVAMRNVLSPEAPVPVKHSRVGCINFLQQTPEIDVCRLHVLGEPPIRIGTR